MEPRLEKSNKGFNELKQNVIDKGLCTICGTCEGVCPEGAIQFLSEDDEWIPILIGECNSCGICVRVCPGAEVDIPKIEKFIFGKLREEKKEDLGVFQKAMVAYSTNEEIRTKGASGGIVTQLLVYALKKGMIDGAIISDFNKQTPWRPESKLTNSSSEIIKGAQSKYSAVPVNSTLKKAVDSGFKELAVVGCSCHIEALRKIQYFNTPSKISKSIKILIGLFCGTQFYFEGTRHLLVEWCDVGNMRDIKKLEYRGGGWPGHFIVSLKNGVTKVIDRHKYVHHMLTPAYQRDRCVMCLDWSAELADISVGDYWHPSMKPGEERGKSTVLIRTEIGKKLIENAADEGVIKIEEIDPFIITSSAGFEFKKHGAAFRHKWRKSHGWPVPNYNLKIDYSPFKRDFYFTPEK